MDDLKFTRWLLISDVDGTLTGNDGGVMALAGLGVQVALVLNSSRPRASVERTLDLLPPALRIEGLISAMGTEIWLAGVEQREWTLSFDGWDRGPIDALMAKIGILQHRPELQTPYKASFSVPSEYWPTLRRKVIELVPDTQVVTSGNSDFDVLPAAAGKDRAAQWVARRLGFDPQRVIVAGDSGNDLAMFRSAQKAIAVGNARSELLERADPQRTYFAEEEHAFGIIEGLRHWGAIR